MKLKKNLVFMVGSVVALVLVLLSSAFLVKQYLRVAEVEKARVEKQQRLDQLNARNSFPNTENVAVEQQNVDVLQQNLSALLTVLRRGQPTDPAVSPVQFNPRLAAAVTELKNHAQVYQLELPAGFGFSFERYLEGAIPLEKDVQRLVRQLQAVKNAVELLADCGVTKLVSVERQAFDQAPESGAGTSGRAVARGRAAPTQNPAATAKAGTELQADPDGLFTYERIKLRFVAKEPAVWRVLNEFATAPRFMLVRSLTTATDSKVTAYVPEAKNAPKAPASGESFSIRKKRLVAGEEPVTVDLTVDVFHFTSEISG